VRQRCELIPPPPPPSPSSRFGRRRLFIRITATSGSGAKRPGGREGGVPLPRCALTRTSVSGPEVGRIIDETPARDESWNTGGNFKNSRREGGGGDQVGGSALENSSAQGSMEGILRGESTRKIEKRVDSKFRIAPRRKLELISHDGAVIRSGTAPGQFPVFSISNFPGRISSFRFSYSPTPTFTAFPPWCPAAPAGVVDRFSGR